MTLAMIAAAAPESGLITGYLFENPWPLGLLLLIAGAVIGGFALREGRTARLPVAAVLLLFGVAVIGLGLFVTTSGEHAERIARRLVAAVEGNDLTGADRLLSDEMTYGATDLTNLPLGDKVDMMEALAEFAAEVTIVDNAVTTLDYATVSSDEGHVRMTLWTDVTGTSEGLGQIQTTARSSWIIVVRREVDGQWRVRRIIWVELNGHAPPVNRM